MGRRPGRPNRSKRIPNGSFWFYVSHFFDNYILSVLARKLRFMRLFCRFCEVKPSIRAGAIETHFVHVRLGFWKQHFFGHVVLQTFPVFFRVLWTTQKNEPLPSMPSPSKTKLQFWIKFKFCHRVSNRILRLYCGNAREPSVPKWWAGKYYISDSLNGSKSTKSKKQIWASEVFLLLIAVFEKHLICFFV